jgi:hypothetical protein
MKGAGGGKRKSRKPARVEPDDRPRGYEAHRMRQLWRDIDQSRRKAGLAPAPEEAAPPPWWEIVGMLGWANAIAGDAVAWITPAACALLVSGTAMLRQLPVVGRLADLVPTPGTESRTAGHGTASNGHGPESTGRVVEPAGGESNGHWDE